jgi:hypothetical protein
MTSVNRNRYNPFHTGVCIEEKHEAAWKVPGIELLLDSNCKYHFYCLRKLFLNMVMNAT